MKSLYNRSHFLFIALFGIGVLYSGYTLYNLPTALEKVSGRIDLNIINDAQPVLNKTYLVIGLTLLVGVVVLVQFLYHLNSVSTNQALDFGETQKGESEEQSDEKASAESDNTSLAAKEILDGIKSIKDEKKKYEKLLSKLCMKIEASQGILYEVKKEKSKRYIEMLTSFAFSLPESETLSYEFGEGLAGQVAKEGKKINIENIPEGYINIISGLGSASPNHLVIYPIVVDKNVVAIAEIASFKKITEADEKLIAEVLKIEEVKTKPTKTTTKAAKKEGVKGSVEEKKK